MKIILCAFVVLLLVNTFVGCAPQPDPLLGNIFGGVLGAVGGVVGGVVGGALTLVNCALGTLVACAGGLLNIASTVFFSIISGCAENRQVVWSSCGNFKSQMTAVQEQIGCSSVDRHVVKTIRQISKEQLRCSINGLATRIVSLNHIFLYKLN